MDPLEIHDRAQRAFASLLAHVTDEQLSLPTPCERWDVATLIAHVNGANLWVESFTGVDATGLPDDRSAAFAASADAANAVFAAPDGLTRTYDLPFGTLPGSIFAVIRAGDVYTHAWDLATAIGADTDLDAELGDTIHAATTPFLSPALRGDSKPFGDEQPCPPDRPIADRLAAFLGRRVV